VPACLAALPLAARYLPGGRSGPRLRVDVFGTILAIAAVGLLMFPLVQSGAVGWPGWAVVTVAGALSKKAIPAMGRWSVVLGAVVMALGVAGVADRFGWLRPRLRRRRRAAGGLASRRRRGRPVPAPADRRLSHAPGPTVP